MPTPSKPVSVIKMEGRSHRTKKELRQREKAESALLTGISLAESPEVKKNKAAHKEFLRITKLLKSIDKNDDLYGASINRYCLIFAETLEFEEKREKVYEQLCEFQEKKQELIDKEELTYKEAFQIETSMQKNVVSIDKQIQAKRKMLSDIEKENIMTIASSLRSIPKTTEKKVNPLKEVLSG